MAAVAIEWCARDYRPVEAFVGASLVGEDIACCDFQAYYPAKRTAQEIHLPPHVATLSAAEKAAITVLIINPARLDEVRGSIGGTWVEQRRYEAPSDSRFPGAALAKLIARRTGAYGSYALFVYRRSSE